MNTFEYITVLVSIVVGLAIADLATSTHRLLRAGKLVLWDWISPTAALLILLELFNLWWRWHGFGGTTLGQVAPYFGTLLLLFLAASAALPDEVPADGLSLRDYFNDNRRYFWSVYTAYVASSIGLATAQAYLEGVPIQSILSEMGADYFTIAVYFALIFVRRPVFSGIALVATLVWVISDWWGMPLAGIA